jgi:hypothetical protein
MLRLSHILLVIIGLTCSGCVCHPSLYKNVPTDTPTRPTVKTSWTESRDYGFTSVGQFVLSRGESTDNGKLGIRVVDFVPSKCRSLFAEYPDPPKVVLEFYRPADKQTLCTVTLDGPIANSSIDRAEMCGNKTGFSVVGINGLNAHDGWVSFDLRK